MPATNWFLPFGLLPADESRRRSLFQLESAAVSRRRCARIYSLAAAKEPHSRGSGAPEKPVRARREPASWAAHPRCSRLDINQEGPDLFLYISSGLGILSFTFIDAGVITFQAEPDNRWGGRPAHRVASLCYRV